MLSSCPWVRHFHTLPRVSVTLVYDCVSVALPRLRHSAPDEATQVPPPQSESVSACVGERLNGSSM